MKLTWTADLPEERQREIERSFHASYITRQRLEEILRDKINTARKATRSNDRYTSPSWAYQQADSIGFERALEEVISLLMSKNPD